MPNLIISFKFKMLTVILLICVPIGTVTSSNNAIDENLKESPSSTNDVADALYQIAQILRTNQNNSNLYERLALLEANAKLTQKQNILVESRLKELESKVLEMNSKVMTLSDVLTRAEVLERSTKSLMENFEEKLSALATEILRLKSVAVNADDSLPSSDLKENLIQQDTREVGDREICSTALPSSSEGSNSEQCWFTVEGKLANWTTAHQFCRFKGGMLVSASSKVFLIANLTKESNQVFWISETSKILLKENPIEQNRIREELKSELPFTDGDGVDQTERDPDVIDLLENYSKNKSPGVIDIRSLPNLEERNENIEKNVYVSNVKIVHDDGFISSVGDFNGKRLSKRSPDDFISLAMPQDAVKFKEFLQMQNSEAIEEENLFVPKETMSDSNINPPISSALLSFLKAVSFNTITKDHDEESSCPMIHCTHTNCVVSVDDCSKMKAFWCQR